MLIVTVFSASNAPPGETLSFEPSHVSTSLGTGAI